MNFRIFYICVEIVSEERNDELRKRRQQRSKPTPCIETLEQEILMLNEAGIFTIRWQ